LLSPPTPESVGIPAVTYDISVGIVEDDAVLRKSLAGWWANERIVVA